MVYLNQNNHFYNFRPIQALAWAASSTVKFQSEEGFFFSRSIFRWNKTRTAVTNLKQTRNLFLLYIRLTMKNLIGREHSINDKCIICCRYYIYHVKFIVCLVTKPLGVFSSGTKWRNASDELCEKCIIKQICLRLRLMTQTSALIIHDIMLNLIQ